MLNLEPVCLLHEWKLFAIIKEIWGDPERPGAQEPLRVLLGLKTCLGTQTKDYALVRQEIGGPQYEHLESPPVDRYSRRGRRRSQTMPTKEMLFSCSVMSGSLRPHGLQHARLPCPSPTPGACSNSCPSSRWCHPTISSSVCPLLLPPSIFSFPLLCFRWPEYWSFSISPSNEYSGLISFRMDWLDLLTVQGTLTGLLHYHNLKASILLCSAFFMVQLSCLCMPVFLLKANPGRAGHSCSPGDMPRSKVGK